MEPLGGRHRGIRPGIRRLFHIERRRGARGNADLDEEISFHLAARTEQLARAGTPRDAAWAEAVRRFAGPGHTLGEAQDRLYRTARLEERQMSVRDALGGAWRALGRAARVLTRRPGFAAVVVTTLALGIGATAAMFAVIDGVLLRPLPFGHPDQLVSVGHSSRALKVDRIGQSAASYWTYQRYARSLAGIAIYDENGVNVSDPLGGGAPQRLSSADVTASLFPLLQVTPKLGRSFTAQEDAPHGPAVVMISEALWRNRFGADPRVIGRTLEVNGVSREIIGVMPERFRFPSAGVALWLPLALDPGDQYPGSLNFTGIARLRAGMTVEGAERDLAAALPHMVDVAPNAAPGVSTQALLDQVKFVPVVTPLRDAMVGGVARTLWIVAATAALVLLVACANVANLVLVRADGRRRELAVRAALGAGRFRALAPFVAELALLGAIAGAVGLAVAALGIDVLVRLGPAELPRLAEVRVGASVIAFTLVVTALVVLACGAIPLLRLGGESLGLIMREGGRGGTEGRARQRARGVLVIAQFALAVVILAGSGLLYRSFRALHDVRPGWSGDHVATFWLSLPAAGYPDDSAVVRFAARLTEAVAQVPGVRSVGLSSRLPLEQEGSSTSPIWVEDDPSALQQLPPLQLVTTIDGGYFRTLGIPVIAGRAFRSLDHEQRPDEAIVNRATAELFWHDSTGVRALGKRLRAVPNGPWYTVVGVAGNVRDTSLEAPPVPSVYYPQVPMPNATYSEVARTMGLVVRTAGDPMAAVRPIERIVAGLDPTLAVFDVKPMRAVVQASIARLSFTMMILGAAAAITLILSAVGLYGVIAYVVSMRTRELGVRVALGAMPGAVARMVTQQGLALAAAGILIGLVLFGVVARFIRALLFGVALADPITLGAVTVVLLGIAVLATWVPARRAAQADPTEALRSE